MFGMKRGACNFAFHNFFELAVDGVALVADYWCLVEGAYCNWSPGLIRNL